MSPRINWEEYDSSASQFESVKPGIHHVVVASAEERESKKGDAYFSVRLKQADGEATVCFDTIMLSGKGLAMGLSKLAMLGFVPGEREEILAAELIGKKAWISAKEDTYEGKTRLAVDISARGSRCGYWPEEDPPEVPDNDFDNAPF